MTQATNNLAIAQNRIIIALLSVLCAIGIGAVLYQARQIMLPFSLAVFISFIMNPLIEFFERRRVPGMLSILIVLLITTLTIITFGIIINASISSFADELPKYEARFSSLVSKIKVLLNLPPDAFQGNFETQDRDRLMAMLQDFSIPGFISRILGSITNFLSNTLTVILFLLFILIGRQQMIKKFSRAFDATTSNRLTAVLGNINQQIQKYIIAKTVVSAVTATLVTIILFLFGVQFALIWGLLTFFLNFIPNIGSAIATILPLSIILIQFENYFLIFWIAICLSTVQLIMGNVIDPKYVGRSINLSPLFALFALIFWGWLWGIVGMFLAIPISVMIKIVFENIETLKPLSVLMSEQQ